MKERQNVLEHWLKFSDADVEANRGGALSGSQSTRLLWSGIWRLGLGPLLIVGGVIVSLVVDTSLFAILAITAAGIGLYLTWRGFAFVVDSRQLTVAFVTAPLKLRVVRGKTTSYFADVGPVSKRISTSAYNALPGGAILHLYYAPGCRSLLSLEPASASEPKPDHPFGPDSKHAWDRLRWSWVLMTIGALGVAIGLHQVAVAHPARPVAVEGVMVNYVETHGRSTSRTTYMDNGQSYTPRSEDTYDPPAPDWGSMIGQPVTLFVNSGTGDVLAVNFEGKLHAGDWYEHPEHQTTFEQVNGAITAGAAAVTALLGVVLLLRDRRAAESALGDDPALRPARYAPPTVGTTGNLVTPAIGIGIVLAVFAGFFFAVFASQK